MRGSCGRKKGVKRGSWEVKMAEVHYIHVWNCQGFKRRRKLRGKPRWHAWSSLVTCACNLSTEGRDKSLLEAPWPAGLVCVACFIPVRDYLRKQGGRIWGMTGLTFDLHMQLHTHEHKCTRAHTECIEPQGVGRERTRGSCSEIAWSLGLLGTSPSFQHTFLRLTVGTMHLGWPLPQPHQSFWDLNTILAWRRAFVGTIVRVDWLEAFSSSSFYSGDTQLVFSLM